MWPPNGFEPLSEPLFKLFDDLAVITRVNAFIPHLLGIARIRSINASATWYHCVVDFMICFCIDEEYVKEEPLFHVNALSEKSKTITNFVRLLVCSYSYDNNEII